MEVAVDGITRDDRASEQFVLSRELVRLMPNIADQDAISISLTDKDRADLAAATPSGQPMRIGVVKQIEPVLRYNGGAFEQGVSKRAPDGMAVWAVSVTSPEAVALRVHFADFSLPAGAEMFFHDGTGQAHGPYTGQGRNGDGEFWTRSISSNTGVIQLRFNAGTAEGALRNISFTVSELAHIHSRNNAGPGAGGIASHDTWPCSDNVSCLVDVNCVNTGPAGPAEGAVAKMEWISGQFVNTCSGGLLADTDGSSQIPYFLTANHCMSSSISNLETWFNYTTDSCNGVCPHNILTGGAPPSDTIGFTVLASNSTSDFTLGTLDEAPPAGAVFLGWNNSPVAFTNGAQLYRISNANFGPQVYSQQQVDTGAGTCNGLPRGNIIYSSNNTGATMGGSSGSPVVNAAGEVVGQLYGCCGFNCADDCDFASNSTIDGAFAVTWPSVAEFLDPQGGCTGDPECDDGLFCTGTETCVSGACQSSGDPCTGGTTCNESTDTCDAPACDDDGACEAGENCNNCPGDCRQKANGNPNGRYCCDGDLPNCGDSRCNESGWVCGGGGGCTSDPECDDGQFCNGAETCAGGSCQGGSDPCPGQGCDEASDTCVSCGGSGTSCGSNSDCCSNKCRRGKCKGN